MPNIASYILLNYILLKASFVVFFCLGLREQKKVGIHWPKQLSGISYILGKNSQSTNVSRYHGLEKDVITCNQFYQHSMSFWADIISPKKKKKIQKSICFTSLSFTCNKTGFSFCYLIFSVKNNRNEVSVWVLEITLTVRKEPFKNFVPSLKKTLWAEQLRLILFVFLYLI
jgi:hypothetical protein